MRYPHLLWGMLLGLLVGCTSAPPPTAPGAVTVVATRVPTATSVAAAPPRTTASADTPASPLPTRTPVPIATAPPLATLAPISRFTQAAGLFSIDLPAGWEVTDLSDNRASITSLDHPQGQAAILVLVLDGSAVPAGTDLTRQLADFTNSIFGGRTFAIDPPTTTGTNEARARFRLEDITADERRKPTEGLALVQRSGDYYSFLAAVAQTEHFVVLEPTLTALLESYTLDPAAAQRVVPPPVTPTPEPEPLPFRELAVYPQARLLPADDRGRQTVEPRITEDFPTADYAIYALPRDTDFSNVRQFYVNSNGGWQDVTLLFPSLLESEVEDVAVLRRGSQMLVVSAFADVLNDRQILVVVLLEE